MAAEVSILVTATDKASGVLRGIANTLGNIAKTAAGIAVAGGVAFVALGKQALDATAEYERMSLTMESLVARELRAADSTLTMSSALELAGDKAKELLGWIQEVAIKSPFDMASVQIAYRQALTYGFASDEAKKLTQNMVDFAAANGLTAEAMNTVSYALGQINNNDKVLMLDLRQLMQVGVPVLDILQEMGMGFEDVSDGAVKSADFISKFNEIMERDFGGAAARQLATWTGLLNTFGDLKKMALRELFAGIFDVLQPMVSKFAEWLQGPGLEKMREWGVELGNLTKGVIDFLGSLKGKGFEDLANMAGDFWVNFSGELLKRVRDVDWGELSRTIAEKISDIDWNLLGQKFGAGLRNVFGIISTVAQEVDWGALFSATLNAAAEAFVGVFGVTMNEAKRIVGDTLAGIKLSFTTAFSSIISTLVAIFQAMPAYLAAVGVTAGQRLMMNLANAIKAGLSMVLAAIRNIASAISNALGSINIPLLGGGGSVKVGTTSGGQKKRARGGPVSAYGAYTVGENGPETLVMGGRGGNIIPNGGINVNVMISSFLSLSDQADAEAKLTPIIQRAIRSARGVA